MQTKTHNLLPKTMPGTVHAQYVRCGKKNCRCANGELHGAYYYHFVYTDGKLRKRYLKASEVADVQSACIARQSARRCEIKANRETWALFRDLRERLGDFHLQGD